MNEILTKKLAALKAFKSAGYEVKEEDLFEKGLWRVRVELQSEVRELTFMEFGYYAPPHYHDQTEKLELTSGEIKYFLSSDSGTSWSEKLAKPGDSIEVSKNILHCLKIVSSGGAIVSQVPSQNRATVFSEVQGPMNN